MQSLFATISKLESQSKPYFPEIVCFCQDHPWRDIVYICLKPDCNIYPRIACPACLLQKHSPHLSDLIELKEVYLQTTGQLFQLNYPKDTLVNELRQLVTSQNKFLTNDHIDTMMDKLKEEMLESIEKVRESLKLKVKSHLDLYDAAVQELESLFHKAYSLEDVRIALDKYHKSTINLEELNKEIHRYANSEERFSLVKQAQARFNRFRMEIDTVYIESVYSFCSRKIMDDIDLLKLTVESLKNRGKIEELVKRREEIPLWALDMIRPQRKDSTIIRDREFDIISSFLGQKNVKYTLIYRGTRDGMNSKVFHQKCDGKGPTLVLCQSKQFEKIFGGVSFGKWSSPLQGQYTKDNQGFLFSLTNQTKHVIHTNEQNAYYNKESYGPTFGSGHDLMISSDFTKCMANLGHTYKAIVGEYQSNEARNYLAGAFNFDLKELEVYIFEI